MEGWEGKVDPNKRGSQGFLWEQCGGSVVSASDLGPDGREFKPWLVHPSCVLRQNT